MSLDLVTYGGAKPNSPADAHFTDEAFAKCLRDLPPCGGAITWPNVTLYFTKPINLTSGPQTVHLVGEAPNCSVLTPLFAPTELGDALLAAGPGNKFARLFNFSLIAGDGTRPTTNPDHTPIAIDPRNPTRNGIAARGGQAGGFNSLVIDHVEVRGFAGHACLIQGATGPVKLRDFQFQSCAGVGLRLGLQGTGDAPTPVQDVATDGGNIQDCDGGVSVDGGSKLTVKGTDIELVAASQPALDFGTGTTANSVCYGVTVENVTVSLADQKTNTAPCVVRFRACQGVVVLGGLNYALTGCDNYQFSDGRGPSVAIEIRPGFYNNGAHLGHKFGYFGKNFSKNKVAWNVACNGGTYSGPPYQGIVDFLVP